MTDPKFPIDAETIRTLAGLLDETGLTEIEVEDGDRKLRVARNGAALAGGYPGHLPHAGAAMAPAEGAEARNGVADASHPGAVSSPMVGTAYLAPEPGAPTYVKLGDMVSEGDTLLIIEAMKVMNPIRAPRGGRVASVLVENGSPVEYGQVLMVID